MSNLLVLPTVMVNNVPEPRMILSVLPTFESTLFQASCLVQSIFVHIVGLNCFT